MLVMQGKLVSSLIGTIHNFIKLLLNSVNYSYDQLLLLFSS